MPIIAHLVDPVSGNSARINNEGELIIGAQDHSLPYTASRSTAGTSNIVPLVSNNRFIITYLIVSSDKTNVDTQVDVYETRTIDGNASTAENVILSGGMGKNDRVVLGGLDLATLPSRFINIETDTLATITVTVMGYHEKSR